MPDHLIADAFSALLRPLLRFVFVDILLHAIFETFIQGSGYFVCRLFGRQVDPVGWVAGLVGISIWASLAAAFYLLMQS